MHALIFQDAEWRKVTSRKKEKVSGNLYSEHSEKKTYLHLEYLESNAL